MPDERFEELKKRIEVLEGKCDVPEDPGSVEVTVPKLKKLLKKRHGPKYVLSSSQERIIKGIAEFSAHLREVGILENRFRVMHFMSQAAHETAHFRVLAEYASGRAYEGRRDLGNTQPGDGQRYKGRGIFMLTGRANYRSAGKRLGVDLEGDPELAKDPEVSVRTAADYWKSRKLNPLADGDDPSNVRRITKVINGGYNGYEDRLAYFMAAGTVW